MKAEETLRRGLWTPTRDQSVRFRAVRHRVLQLTATLIAGGLVVWLGQMAVKSHGRAASAAVPVPVEAATPAVTANVHTNPAIAPAAVETYSYNFDNGTADWNLPAGFWSWVSSEGGHALRGTGNHEARLTAHSGDVSSLRFRFRLEDWQSGVTVNLLENAPSGVHVRYLVQFGTQGISIGKQQGPQPDPVLAVGFVPISWNVFYEARILVGGGSIDVFLNGEPVVGLDDPNPPPPGFVGFHAWDNSVALVDDVEVQFGAAEAPPHPRAPRSPMALTLGPDVGPFVGGVHTGNISLAGNDTLTLSQGRYNLREGEFNLSGNARLRIERGAVLVLNQAVNQWGFHLKDAAVLEIDGGNVVTDGGPTKMISASGASSVTVRNAKPWIHQISADQDATVSIINSRFVTSLGGAIQLVGRASFDIQDSKVGSIGLVIPPGSSLQATGLRTGTFSDFDLRRDLTVAGIGYNLRMRNVELVVDTLGAGPFERGWVISAAETAAVRITDSVLRKVNLNLEPSGPDFAVSGLRLAQPVSRTVAGTVLNNVTVLGQWGFWVSGTRQATFDDCEGLWFFLYDTAKVLMRNSSMNEFDPRQYRGVLTFENSRWNGIGEIIDGNDFVMAGTVTITGRLGAGYFSWSRSAVTRRFPILVTNSAGAPAAGVGITLTRGSQVVTATSGPTGEASVDLRFTDQDYMLPWQLTTSMGHAPLSVNFITSTPVTLSPQAAPTGLTAAASGSSVLLQWSAPTTGSVPTGYIIEAGSEPGQANLASFPTGSTATSYSKSDVGNGTYYVRVRATGPVGTSGPSNEATLVVDDGRCSSPPSAPSGLAIVSNSGGTVQLSWAAAAASWTAATGAPTTYVLEAGLAPGAANLANIDLGSAATSFTATGVGRGTYYVRVRAKNACGTSGASNEIVVVVS